MLIGIDASQAARGEKTGIEYLTSQLILNLKEIDHTNSYFLFTNAKLDKEYRGHNFKEIFIPLKKFWQSLRLPAALLKYRPELFVEIGYILPKFIPKKSICFVHDLSSKYFPSAYSSTEKILLNRSFKQALRAQVLIFISNQSKKDYLKFYPNYKGKCYVIYPGYNQTLFKKISKPKNILNLNSDYILYLGRIEKRKNIENLIAAYNIFCQKNGYDIKLVIAGKPGFGFDQINTTINKLDAKIKANIVIPGYIAEKDLPNLYAKAKLFIFPSLYEGFGIPILEAMATGTPVICSNTSSLPEAGGEAVEYFDPTNPEEIAKSIEKILSDKDLQNQMIKKGFIQSSKFNYKKMAREVLNIIDEIK